MGKLLGKAVGSLAKSLRAKKTPEPVGISERHARNTSDPGAAEEKVNRVSSRPIGEGVGKKVRELSQELGGVESSLWPWTKYPGFSDNMPGTPDVARPTDGRPDPEAQERFEEKAGGNDFQSTLEAITGKGANGTLLEIINERRAAAQGPGSTSFERYLEGGGWLETHGA